MCMIICIPIRAYIHAYIMSVFLKVGLFINGHISLKACPDTPTVGVLSMIEVLKGLLRLSTHQINSMALTASRRSLFRVNSRVSTQRLNSSSFLGSIL